MKRSILLKKSNNLNVMSKKKRLRIAIVIKNFVATGGAERYAVETAMRILEKGHKIDLYARTIDSSLTKGMTVFKVPDKMKFSSVLSLYSFSSISSKLLTGKAYDVIHSHDKGCQGHLSTLHTFSFKRGMRDMSLLKRINDFGLSPRAWLYIHLEKRQIDSGRLAAVSEVIKTDIQESHNRKHDISIITPGVDIEKFSPEKIYAMRDKVRKEERVAPDEIVVLFVGSEFKRKGLDFVIPALGKKMKLFVVGRKERMPHYKKLAEQYDLSDQIVFTGLTEDILRYYALADIVVLPSVSEAFGMTVLEGMACGLPVITSRAAGCASLVKTGYNGFVFSDPGQLPGILKTMRNKEVRIKIGTRARQKAEDHTWDETAYQYERLYYEIAGSNT